MQWKYIGYDLICNKKGSITCWTCFLGKKIKEDLPKVQFIRALLSSTKDEDEIPIENMLISKPMYV